MDEQTKLAPTKLVQIVERMTAIQAVIGDSSLPEDAVTVLAKSEVPTPIPIGSDFSIPEAIPLAEVAPPMAEIIPETMLKLPKQVPATAIAPPVAEIYTDSEEIAENLFSRFEAEEIPEAMPLENEPPPVSKEDSPYDVEVPETMPIESGTADDAEEKDEAAESATSGRVGRSHRRGFPFSGASNADWVAPAIGLLGDIALGNDDDAISLPDRETGASAEPSESNANGELTSAIKELTEAVKKLSSLMERSGSSGGSSGREMTPVEPSPRELFDMHKEAVGSSSRAMIARMLGSETARPGKGTMGGAAESAGATPAPAYPAATTAPMRVAQRSRREAS